MDKRHSLLMKNTIIIFFSKFCTQFLSFLILPFITKKLTTGEYGSFDLISTYGWLIVPYMSLQLENGIFRFLIDKRKSEDGQIEIITNGILSLLLQFVIFSIIYLVIGFCFSIENYWFIYFYAVSSLFLNIPLYISRGLGDNLNYGIASIITGCTNVMLSLVTIYIFDMRVEGLVISAVISNVIGAIYLVARKKICSKIKIKKLNRKKAKELISFSAPLVPNMTSAWIMNVSDKTMISILLSVSVNGIYSVCTKFTMILSHVYSVFNTSWTESASASYNDSERDKYFSTTVDNIYKICSSICIIVLSSMPIVFDILIDKKFLSAYQYIPILLLASLFEMFSGIIGGIYISLKLSKKIALSTFIAGIINVLINLIFMKKYGLIIACISTLISYFALSLYRLYDIKKSVELKLNYKIYLMSFIMFLIVTLQYYMKNSILCILTTIIVMIYSYFLNKNLFTILKNKIKKKG